MNYTQVINPSWANAAHTVINCLVTFDGIGEVSFSASPSDPYAHSQEIFARAKAGEFGVVAEYISPPPAPIVVRPISPRQIRQALTRAGMRTQVETAVAGGNQDLKDWWEFSTTFERANPLVASMGEALGQTPDQLDALWVLGASL